MNWLLKIWPLMWKTTHYKVVEELRTEIERERVKNIWTQIQRTPGREAWE